MWRTAYRLALEGRQLGPCRVLLPADATHGRWHCLYNRGIRRDVVAIDATTGETLWLYRLDEGERGAVAPRRNSGRGVAYWRGSRRGEGSRIFTITPGFQLVALDALSGLPVAEFARRHRRPEGRSATGRRPAEDAAWKQLPAGDRGRCCRGGGFLFRGGAPPSKVAVPGWIRGYDARTGALLWAFHTVPQPGEYGAQTWDDNSNAYTGNTAVWAPFTADAARGLVYLPVEAPTADFTGDIAPATICSRMRWCALMPRPASASGTTRSFTTTSGTMTCRQHRCWPTSR